MRTHPLALALALGATVAAPLDAQRARLTIEPRVSALPASDLWGQETVSSSATVTSATGTVEQVTRSRRTVIDREGLALVGARATYAPGGGAWRVALDAATGRTHLNAHVAYRTVVEPFSGGVGQSYAYQQLQHQPLRLTQVALRGARELVAAGAAFEASAGLLAQHLFVRRTFALRPPYTNGVAIAHRRESYLDPAAVVGLSISPDAGPLRGARLSLQSTHPWRSPAMANTYGDIGDGSPNSTDRQWQWQPEIALSWRLGAR